jgi:hypothetical protein
MSTFRLSFIQRFGIVHVQQKDWTMTEADEADTPLYDMVLVDGLSQKLKYQLALVQETFQWVARSVVGNPWQQPLLLDGAWNFGETERLVLTADRTFAALSEILRQKPASGFPHRLSGFSG